MSPGPSGAQNSPAGGGWNAAPTRTVGQTPEGSMYNNQAAAPPMRPLDQTTSGAALAHAATDVPGGGNVPGQEILQPITQLQQAPVAQPLRDPRGASGVQPVSYQAPADDPNTVAHSVYASNQGDSQPAGANTAPYRPGSTAAAPAAAAKGPTDHGATYGFDGNYAWLQGQLEYSAATRVWKLRYVPIDGPTDRFGGSVVLADSDLLAGHKAGEFVSVKGQLDGRPGPQGSFSPLYRVSQVQRLSE
jgi:hypothetical protein